MSFFYRVFLTSLVGIIVLCSNTYGQLVSKGSEFWPHYNASVSLDSSWSFVADYSHRYSNFEFDQEVQWIARAGFGYQITDKLNFSAGYAYSEYFSGANVRRENRPWQQFLLVNKFSRFSLNSRLRLEERFNKDNKGNRFNYRLRYQMLLLAPILPRQKLTLLLSAEPMFNLGKEVNGNHFDQNRLSAGLQIKVAKRVFFVPAYQNTYQLQSNKKDFKRLDILRTGIVYKR